MVVILHKTVDFPHLNEGLNKMIVSFLGPEQPGSCKLPMSFGECLKKAESWKGT